MYELTQSKAENTLNLMTVPDLADTVAVTVGNAYLIPSDESNADKRGRFYMRTVRAIAIGMT